MRRWIAAGIVLLVALVGVLLMRGSPRQPRPHPSASTSSSAVRPPKLSATSASGSTEVEPVPPTVAPPAPSAEEADTLATARIVGSVTTPDGKPAPALVALLEQPVRGRPHHRLANAKAGTYEFRVRPGSWALRAESDRGISRHGYADAVEGQAVRVDLLLLPTRVLTGLVTDPDGRPVPGATVTPEASGFLRSVTTGLDGRYRLPVLEPGYPLRAEASGWGAGQAQPEHTEAGEVACDLQLTRPLTISGRVRNRQGTPVPGAVVRALPPGFMQVEAFAAVATTDAEGAYALTGLEPGMHQLIAEAAAFTGNDWLQVEAGTRDVGLVLRRVSHVRGRVVERGTDAPVPHATISTPWARASATDLSGAFDLEVHSPCRIAIEARAEGFAVAASREIAVGVEQDVSGIVIELVEGGSIDGLVVGARTAALVAGAKVVLSDDKRGAVSDADGRFVFQHLTAGRHGITVSDDSGAVVTQEIEVADGGTSHAVFRLPAGGGRIFGRVRDLSGEAHDRFAIWHGDGTAHCPFSTRPDAEGRYEVKPLQEGDYVVSFQLGALYVRSWDRRVHVGPGESVQLDIVIPRGVRVSGVARRGGQPHTGIPFRIQSEGFWADVRTDDDGRYELEGIPPGDYRPNGDESRSAFVVPDGMSEVTWDIDLPENQDPHDGR